MTSRTTTTWSVEEQSFVDDDNLSLSMTSQLTLRQLDFLVLLLVLEDLAKESWILEHDLIDAPDGTAAFLH